jgi:hypothetical protein
LVRRHKRARKHWQVYVVRSWLKSVVQGNIALPSEQPKLSCAVRPTVSSSIQITVFALRV